MAYTYCAKDFARFLDDMATKMAESGAADIKELYTLRAGATMLELTDSLCDKLVESLQGESSAAKMTITIPVNLGNSSLK